MYLNKLHAVFETAVDGMIIIQQNGIIDEVNQSACTLFGYKKEELIGQNINILMPEPYHSGHEQYLQNYHSSGQKKIIGIGREVTGKRKDATLFPCRLAVSESEENGQRFYVGLIHDLTKEVENRIFMRNYQRQLEVTVVERTKEMAEVIKKQQDTEKQLRHSNELYTTIARNFPNGTITLLNHNLDYVFVEGEGLTQFGIETEYLIGTNYLQRVREEIKPRIIEKLNLVMQGNAQVFEVSLNDHTFLLDAVPLMDENKQVHQILIIETNITQIKRAEAEIRKSLEKEKELGELKSRFVSVASHEFKTPLASIMSSATLIDKYAQSSLWEKVQQHAERIQKNVRNLNLILNDFLSLEKINQGVLKYEVASFNLSELLTEVLESLTPIYKQGQEVSIQQQNTPLYIQSDIKMVRNILLNLISNALKYSPPQSKVYIRLIESKGKLEIQIQDAGIGIPKEDQANLFTRFFRSSNVVNTEGTGLGLHIVKSYLDLMGGEIKFESKEGVGTTFYLFLPA